MKLSARTDELITYSDGSAELVQRDWSSNGETGEIGGEPCLHVLLALFQSSMTTPAQSEKNAEQSKLVKATRAAGLVDGKVHVIAKDWSTNGKAGEMRRKSVALPVFLSLFQSSMTTTASRCG